MPERIKKIPQQLLEFWNKYTTKQKTIIVSVVATVFLAIVILSVIFTRPSYTELLAQYDDIKDASEAITLLEESSIKYNTSKDGKTIYVQKGDYTTANILLGSNGLSDDTPSFTWDWALNNDMSTTTSEKTRKELLALQDEMRTDLKKMDIVKDASVYINMPKDPYNILEKEEEASITIMLTLTDTMSESYANTIAQAAATAVGNQDTSNVKVIDTAGNLLFSGSEDNGLNGANYNKEEFKTRLRDEITKRLQALLLKEGFDDVQVGDSNIQFNMDEVSELYTEYTPAEGQEQGLYRNSYEYKTTNTNGGSTGIPGTDSNAEDTDYMLSGAAGSSGQTTLNKYEYIPNELKRTIQKEVGTVLPEESSIALVLTRYVVHDEATLKASGELDGMTFDEYIAANNTDTRAAVDQEVLDLIEAATGIAQGSIVVTAWEKPIFQAEVSEGFQLSNYLMIILAVLIIALLIFVVFKGTAPVEVTEQEPELSVEDLLATTKENQSLEDIEFNEVSETRKMIEKFVDENPEAAAQLLRNWLNDDWG